MYYIPFYFHFFLLKKYVCWTDWMHMKLHDINNVDLIWGFICHTFLNTVFFFPVQYVCVKVILYYNWLYQCYHPPCCHPPDDEADCHPPPPDDEVCCVMTWNSNSFDQFSLLVWISNVMVLYLRIYLYNLWSTIATATVSTMTTMTMTTVSTTMTIIWATIDNLSINIYHMFLEDKIMKLIPCNQLLNGFFSQTNDFVSAEFLSIIIPIYTNLNHFNWNWDGWSTMSMTSAWTTWTSINMNH